MIEGQGEASGPGGTIAHLYVNWTPLQPLHGQEAPVHVTSRTLSAVSGTPGNSGCFVVATYSRIRSSIAVVQQPLTTSAPPFEHASNRRPCMITMDGRSPSASLALRLVRARDYVGSFIFR